MHDGGRQGPCASKLSSAALPGGTACGELRAGYRWGSALLSKRLKQGAGRATNGVLPDVEMMVVKKRTVYRVGGMRISEVESGQVIAQAGRHTEISAGKDKVGIAVVRRGTSIGRQVDRLRAPGELPAGPPVRKWHGCERECESDEERRDDDDMENVGISVSQVPATENPEAPAEDWPSRWWDAVRMASVLKLGWTSAAGTATAGPPTRTSDIPRFDKTVNALGTQRHPTGRLKSG
ncbi:hypothetical protein DFH06DRAFT_1140482 [Mycena polygramma]|nr:hypothetical protein DFH06DRAFT_1140482 [Mycena polygramma]